MLYIRNSLIYLDPNLVAESDLVQTLTVIFTNT